MMVARTEPPWVESPEPKAFFRLFVSELRIREFSLAKIDRPKKIEKWSVSSLRVNKTKKNEPFGFFGQCWKLCVKHKAISDDVVVVVCFFSFARCFYYVYRSQLAATHSSHREQQQIAFSSFQMANICEPSIMDL